MTSSRPTNGTEQPVIRVDSAAEQEAYLAATYGDPSMWSVVSQTWRSRGDDADIEVVEVALESGERVEVPFAAAHDDVSFDDSDSEEDRTEWLDTVMEAASTFAADNPPHHPGSLPRFPVPSAARPAAISVPMAVLAVDAGRRGLYAPPRVVVLDYTTREPIGVGEFPGFDPDNWPPECLGDWPPPALVSMPPAQLHGLIARFSACWSRVLDAWFNDKRELTPTLIDDIRRALDYRSRLDLPAMLDAYERLNPDFHNWLTKAR